MLKDWGAFGDEKNHVDMVGGSLPINIILFSIPVILTGILQLLFNACDMVVVGRFSSSNALAAVGATSSLINLLVGLFMGLSAGVNVIAAQFFGAKDYKNIQKTVHTAITLSIICGIFLSILGIAVCRPCLQYMNTPDDVIDLATVYMKIYFAGVPFTLLYNFGAGILRAQGNTRQPLIFLTIAGLVNVVLNLIFVIVFKMSVAGVALATLISQVVSSVLIILYLRDPGSMYYLDFRKLGIDLDIFKKIIRIGIPAGINSMVFFFANIQIQSSVNIFGSQAIAGCSAGASIEGFIYIAMNSLYHASLNFTGQNLGAGQPEKIPKILRLCLLYVTVIGVILGTVVLVFGRQLLSLYTTDTVAIDYGMIRITIIASTYFLCGYMEVIAGIIRGLGYSLIPTIVSLVGACGLRLVWIATAFKAFQSLNVLFISWPISWILTAIAHFTFFFIIRKKFLKSEPAINNLNIT